MSHAVRLGQRGVSLIEAVVAMAVMAFGMLAVVGLQATLRGNADLSRQRSEALRIAQESVENWRAFVSVDAVAGTFDYSDIVDTARTEVDLTGTALLGKVNTRFYRTISVPAPAASPRMKSMVVTVDWDDRNGERQTVRLATVVSGVSPELAGTLSVPPNNLPWASPQGRSRGIPADAKNLPGTGTSVFKPPQPGGGPVAWVFNNTTGIVTSRCTVDPASTTTSLTSGDLTVCTTIRGQLLSGVVKFAADAAIDVAALQVESESPTGSALNLDILLALDPAPAGDPYPATPPWECFDNSTGDQAVAATRSTVVYYCLIFSNNRGTWGGRSRVVPRAFTVPTVPVWEIVATPGATAQVLYKKVCRYTPLSADAGTRNIDHPLDYTTAGSTAFASLSNQNFLVISAGGACPRETSVTGDFFNANTLLHQDGSATYNNP